jgi:hypothetical protein
MDPEANKPPEQKEAELKAELEANEKAKRLRDKALRKGAKAKKIVKKRLENRPGTLQWARAQKKKDQEEAEWLRKKKKNRKKKTSQQRKSRKANRKKR